MKQIAAVAADDNILSLAWSGDSLAATPSTGEVLILDAASRKGSSLAGHGLGNGESAWFGGSLATCGYDGKIRWSGREIHAGRGIIERVKASADGKILGAGQGKALLVFDQDGKPAPGLTGLPASIADFAWDPADSSRVAVVGAGGASLRAEWSPCGRWLVTADQTASVHIYDFTRDYPLNIQGYETKVRAMAFSADGKRLATGGSPVITIWPCTGKKGPEGVTPVQLDGHDGEVVAAAFSPKTGQLATGDGTGMVLIFTFQGDKATRKRLRLDAGISALAWHPENDWLAVGREDGAVSILSLES